MKVTLTLALVALIVDSLIFRWYAHTGYLAYPNPFPRVAAPLFRLDGEAAENTDILETWLWCIGTVAAVMFGLRWAIRPKSN